MLKRDVHQKIVQAVKEAYPGHEGAYFTVEEPASGVDADLASNVAFALSKQVKTAPAVIAQSLAASLKNGLIRSVDVAKNGFLNIKVDDRYLQDAVIGASSKGPSFFQKIPDAKSPAVLIEFVSANPTGPLHIGHGRGAALGDSLARIYRQMGRNVQTEYYVNDMGLQMQILSDSVRLRHEQQGGKEVNFPENGYQGEYISEIAKEMRSKNRDDFSVYPRQYILDWIKKDLELFGVSFDHWFPESDLHKVQKVEAVLETLKGKNALKEKEGALWFAPKGEAHKEGEEEAEADKDRVLKRSDGRYTYFASDIAYHQDKFTRGFRHCIDIWGHDHHGYVPRVQLSLAALGLPEDFLTILLYQLVSLKRDGKRIAMSTRSGQFVTLREILDEVGRDACRFFFAMRSPNSQLDFDVDLAKKKSNENPVYYVQYVHARICSIFREGQKRGVSFNPGAAAQNLPLLTEPAERELAKKVILFDDVLEACLQIHSPHALATYLIDCATLFHKFYDSCRVLDAEPAVRDARFALLNATRTVVGLGLSLLGVSAPEQM